VLVMVVKGKLARSPNHLSLRQTQQLHPQQQGQRRQQQQKGRRQQQQRQQVQVRANVWC
jgi:hypothetical protein